MEIRLWEVMYEKYSMSKILLTLILVVVSSSAMAEWVYIDQNESKEPLSIYADPDTIRKEGNIIKMWALHEFSIPTPEFDFLSAKHKEEYDCKEKKRRVLFMAFYSGHMGDGELVAITTYPEDHFKTTISGSLGEAVLEFACGGFYPKLPRTFPSVSSNVVAEWVEVRRSVEKGSTLYADPATSQKSGNMVTMWELMDSKTAGKGPGTGNKFIHSLVSQAEYDCKDERIRFLDFVGFSENMGKGELIESEIKPISKWMPILPEDITYKRMWKIACGK